MSKINETNYPRRTQANYADTDMLVIQAAGGNTYTTRLEDMREDYEETLAPSLSALQDDINENLATIEAGSTASQAYAKGDFLVFGGRLCKAKTSIAVNATLVLDTNIELASVGGELSSISSDLTSKITGVWTNITASSPSDKVDIIPTDQYRTSGYIIRGGLCFVNVSVVVTADTGDTSTIVLQSGVLPSSLRVYNGQYSTYKTPSWSSFGTPSNQVFAESLFQNGILYIRKAVANDYSISFVYPVASP